MQQHDGLIAPRYDIRDANVLVNAIDLQTISIPVPLPIERRAKRERTSDLEMNPWQMTPSTQRDTFLDQPIV